MARPIVSSWTAVNPTIQPGQAPQINVAFTPAADNKPLWFRFDLKQGRDSWKESDWIPVANKNAGAVTLTYVLNGVPGVPGDWGGSKQVNLEAKLMWGEEGHGRGGEIGHKAAMFSIGGTTPAGTKPVIVSATPVNGSIPIGGPAQLLVTYNSDIDCYLKLSLRPETAWSWTGGLETWQENSPWTHISAGQNRQVTLTYPNVPNDWVPPDTKSISAQITWSADGSGTGGLIIRQSHVFNILAAGQGTAQTPPVITPTPEPILTPTPTPGPTTTPTTTPDTTPDATASGGITDWIKKNWMIVALIGAFLVLVVPGRSNKD